MKTNPSTAETNGRDTKGRFGSGNKFGKGNPHAVRVAQLRTALLNAVSPEDLEAIIQALVQKARQGDVYAAREVLDRTLGKADAVDLSQRIEALEELFSAQLASLTRRRSA